MSTQTKIYPDGNEICAIIGAMPESLCVGFGNTAKEAIDAMLSEMDSYGTFCPICLQEADEIDEQNGGLDVYYSCPDGHTWERHE
ncbi:hypothetical protein M0R72_20460 [Candidatus Pacearchaeota archaeon]|jgi:hypothetical protein|nr:hypothetical protein [Candidatus Pacearchaeota archaeon]